MASKTEIANRGLMKLGQPRVSNIDTDPSPAAVAMSALFDSVRDELLQSYPWNFAIKRVDIAAAVDAPSWGWDNAFLSHQTVCVSLRLKTLTSTP